jgi:putative FmdB family regulatory protein
MPTYGYRCKDCEHQFETLQRMTDEPIQECPKCGGPVARLLFPVGIVFKGSGFHVNDYPSSKNAASENAKKPDVKAESTKETAAAPKD